MSDLQSQLQKLRSRTGYAIWLHGVSWVIAALLGSALLLGWFDWLVHVNNGVMRFCLVAAVLIGCGVLAWRVLIRPLRQQLTDVAIALKIEKRFPGFRDSLASTVQFAEQAESPRLGSPNLQRRVIDETLAKLRDVNLNDVIETREVRRVTWLAVSVCLVVALVAGLRPAEASRALERMVFPFSAPEWFRETELQLVDERLQPLKPESNEYFRRVVQGETFKFYVADRKGRLPEDVTLFLEYDDGEERMKTLRRVNLRDSSGVTRTVCIANIFCDRGPIRFRVIGGDDDRMPERMLQVVPAPQVRSLRVTLHPPEYSRRPQQELAEGVGHFEALIGTRVLIAADANKPLRSAHLHVKNRTVPGVTVSPDGLQVTASFVVQESGHYSYWLELQDREGFENPNAPRYDVKAVADRTPVVRLLEPSTDLRVTPGYGSDATAEGTASTVVIPIRVSVEDDLGIHQVRLRYRIDGDREAAFQSQVLFSAPQPADRHDGETPPPPREYDEPFSWTLRNVKEGMQVEFYVEAVDGFNLKDAAEKNADGDPHIGKSRTRTVAIVSPAEKTADIAGRYAELLEDLIRLERLQRRAHGQVGQLCLQLKTAGRLRAQTDHALLNRIIQDQHDLSHQLVDGEHSIQHRAAKSLGNYHANRLDHPKLKRRLARIVEEMTALQRQFLPEILTELRAVDAAGAANGNPPKRKGPASPLSPAAKLQRLQSAKEKQAEVLKSLRELIGDLTEWRNWQDLKVDLDDLIRNQQEIQQQVGRLKAQTLGVPDDELTTQQKAELAKLAERQERVADRVKTLTGSVEKFIEALRKDAAANRAVIDLLQDFNALVGEQELTVRIETASGKIKRNELGDMAKTQKQLIADLRELSNVLENRGTQDLETLIKRQKQAEAELAELHKQQEERLETLRKLGDDVRTKSERDRLEKLIKEQEQLQKRAEQLTRTLRRLSANRANDATQRAAEGMQRVRKALNRKALEQGRIEQRETLDRLEQARRELARTRTRLEALLAAELLEQFADEIQSLIRRQENVIAETARLKKEYDDAKSWTRTRLITLDQQREEQTRLHGRILELAKSGDAAPVFSLALKRVAGEMSAAIRALAESREKGTQLATALKHERAAKKRLVQLVESVRPENDPSQSGTQQDADGADFAEKTAGPSHLAQLKLLKTLQDELKAETQDLDEKRQPDKPLTPEQKQRLEELVAQQERLADLMRNLLGELGIKADPPTAPVDDGDGAKPQPSKKPTKKQPAKKANASPQEQAPDVLRRVVRRMRDVGKSLADAKTGPPTRKLQQEISDDLARLIRSADRQIANRTGGTPQPLPKKQPSGKKSSAKKSANKKGGANGSNVASKTKKHSGDSDTTIRKAPETLNKINSARRRLIQDVWGHLPDSVKQQIDNMDPETYLPKYKPLISRYFESLAE